MSENAALHPPPEAPATLVEAEFNVFHSSGSPVTLTATHVVSDIIDVREARELVLVFDINAGAASNTVEWIPHFSIAGAKPSASTTDTWFVPTVQDGSVSATLPSLTKYSGANYTLTPEFGLQTFYPMLARFPASDNATDEARYHLTLNVERARWFMLSAACAGAGTLDDLLVKGARVI